jgi:hypothetical protein
MIKIYKLIYKGEIIYVGKTKLTLKRRKGSLNYSVPDDIYKESIIELIEETKDVSRERHWIDLYRDSGINLMNKRGGDHNDDTKYEYIKSKLQKKKEDRDFKKKTDEEHKEMRRLYRINNREKINEKRRQNYRDGKSWYHKKISEPPKLFSIFLI